MTEKSDIETADTITERAGGSRVKLRVLMRSNRLLLAGVLAVALFLAFVLVVGVLSPSLTRKLESGDTIETLFTTMLTVIVTGSTLVVTIGQLILTQENGPLGDQRARMSNSMETRAFVTELTGSPSPVDPAAFLGVILDATTQRARTLRDTVGEDDAALSKAVDDLVEAVAGNANTVRAQLDGAEFGSFDVIFAALGFNYSLKIQQVEHIEDEYDQRLTDEQHGLLDELKTGLSLFGLAREHVKTLYFQWALIDLSRLILYTAVPALAVAGIMLAAVDAATFPGQTFGIEHVVIVVGGAFAVTLLPFLLFVSYILRVLTVAKRTLAIEPLVLRSSEQ